MEPLRQNKIIIFGGTSEGRLLVEHFVGTNLNMVVCVATAYGEDLLPVAENVEVQVGRLDQEEMQKLFQRELPLAVVDATHPYAKVVTDNVQAVCERMKIPYLRVLREKSAFAGVRNDMLETRETAREGQIVYVANVAEAAEFLNTTSGNILVTTGSKELHEYQRIAGFEQRVFARVLPSISVLEQCAGLGMDGKHLLALQGPFSEEFNYALLRQIDAKWLVTKESGKEGGFAEKCEAALRAGAALVIIGRPEQVEGMSLVQCIEEIKRVSGCSEANLLEQPHKAIPKIYLIGMGTGDVRELTVKACDALAQCDVLIGAKRVLDIAKQWKKPQFVNYRKEEIVDYIKGHPEYERIGIVYSGDVGFYSGARDMKKVLTENIPECKVESISGISSSQYLLNQLGISWNETTFVSVHGREERILGTIMENHYTCVLIGNETQMSSLCKALYWLGYEGKVHLGSRLSYEDELITTGTVEDYMNQENERLSVAVFENDHPKAMTYAISDEEFLRGNVPMTKEEIRTVSISKLHLQEDSIVYDVGAGTGSVSVCMERCVKTGKVYAIECNSEGVELIQKNKVKFQAENLEVCEGMAPEVLDSLPAPTHAFIGGSKGQIVEIVDAIRVKNPHTRFVVNAVTIETLSQMEEIAKKYPEYEDMEMICMNVSRSKRLGKHHLMMAENPIYIVSFGGV